MGTALMTAPSGNTTSGRLEALAGETLAGLGLELVHLTYRKEGRRWVLRLLIDRDGGVTLDDCALASEQIGAVLEVEDVIPQSYVLEVSSPGVDRPLFGERDYRRFAGREVQVRTHRPVAGRRQFRGVLAACEEGVVTLTLNEDEVVTLPLGDIASARLEVDLDQELGRPGRGGRPSAGGSSGQEKRGRQ
jgi:ribosome maturation factor RimP